MRYGLTVIGLAGALTLAPAVQAAEAVAAAIAPAGQVEGAPDMAAVAADTANQVEIQAGAPRPGWKIQVADGTLGAAMARWAAASGWQLSWELPVDFPIIAAAEIPGDFEQAIAAAVSSVQPTGYPVMAVFYTGNKIVRIVVKSDQ